MGFDLTTFLAQIVNLLILVWLLKHFLYHPILNVIEKRRHEIADKVQAADNKMALATKAETALKQQQQQFESNRQKRLDEIEKEVAQLKALKLKELHDEMQNQREQMQQDLVQNLTKNQSNIQSLLGQQFLGLTQTVLREWSDATPTDLVLKLFQKKILSLSKKQLSNINKHLINQKVINISSSDRLSKKQQDFVIQLLQKNLQIPEKVKFHFQVRSNLLLGLEVRFDTMMLDWSIKTYLDEIEKNLNDQMMGLMTPQTGRGRK